MTHVQLVIVVPRLYIFKLHKRILAKVLNLKLPSSKRFSLNPKLEAFDVEHSILKKLNLNLKKLYSLKLGTFNFFM